MPSPGKVYTCPSLHAEMTEFRSLHPIKQEPRDNLGHLCASSPYPVSDHKPSRAGFISVSIQYLAHQNDTNFSSKSLFEVTKPHPHCRRLAEASRDLGSSMAQAADALSGLQYSSAPGQTTSTQPRCSGMLKDKTGPIAIFIQDLIQYNLKSTGPVAPAIGEFSSEPFEAEQCIFQVNFCRGRITNQWKETAPVNRRGKKKLVL